MRSPAIVVHYHELWLKGGNRHFFLGKLFAALRRTLGGIQVSCIEKPGDRFVVHLSEAASMDEAVSRIQRVFGVAYYAIARPAERSVEAIVCAAWEELRGLAFDTFAIRAKRSDKSFPQSSMEIEAIVGRVMLERLRAEGRDVRVKLNNPDLACHIEITPGPALIYARKIPGPGGLPANTAGRMTCLLSGGYDSAVAAYHMMKRGAHLSFVHFYGTGAEPGDSSLHVARNLVRQLVPYQFQTRLYCIPFEGIQREIVRYAPEKFRILLYRRMMLRIAEIVAKRERALALVTGDSLAQVASQTLRNLVAVEKASKLPVFRPLIGTDKIEILDTARKIGTYDISSEPFHDCCPVFLPRVPALHAGANELGTAEQSLDVQALVDKGIRGASIESFEFAEGIVKSKERIRRNAETRTALTG
ncbi:MAG TPA: tRNA uracil 4-sulfurtransferase ThiI [Candidatus Acidoferrum sp.]|nr:tRNA uracil 4-sulfurtransferase ThiI [Candidatus Acidoferrum sp.]